MVTVTWQNEQKRCFQSTSKINSDGDFIYNGNWVSYLDKYNYSFHQF